MGRERVNENWAGNQWCDPAAIVRPRSVGELADRMAAATTAGCRVKAIGAGHSFTGAAMTDGVLMQLDAMPSQLRMDPSTGRVLVGAGMRLADLNLALHAHGRALPNLGDIDVQTIAGATATATHGTGLNLGNLSTGITGLELVTATGEVVWCDATTDPELFAVARVSVGALGIITRVELETVPAFNLHSVETAEVVEDLLADWDGFVSSAAHAEFFWMPGTRRALVKRNDHTNEEPGRFTERRVKAEKLLLENLAFGAAMRTVRRFPGSRDRVQKLLGSAVTSSERVGRSFDVFASPRHVRFMEMEYGIPLDALPEAFRRVQDVVASLPEAPSFPIEVRVSAADDIPLSTAHGRASGWIAVHRYKGTDHDPYFRAVEAIMNDYDGRPHWGKWHYQTAETLRPRYPEWDRFAAVRRRVDPSATFTNDYLDRVLGPVEVR